MHPMLCVGDGHSYEQAAIIQWLQTHSTSPVTGQPLDDRGPAAQPCAAADIQAACR